MKSNISFLVSNLKNAGGTQRMLCCLCNLLVNDFIIIIIVHKDGESFFPLDPRVKIISLSNNRLGILQNNLDIYKILKTNATEYYINLDSNSIMLNSLFLPLFTKLILWEHFSIRDNYNKLLFTISRHYAVLRCKELVFLSNYERKAWAEYNSLSHMTSKLIYNPLAIKENTIDNSNRMHLKKFLAIGNNIDVKGFDILIDAWSSIDSDWSLCIVGLDQSQIIILENLITNKDIKNIKLHGKVKNIKDFYRAASVFLLPSRKEATPLVLVESQAFGLPAIVFDHLPGVLELIDHSALIVNFEEKDKGFSKAIELIINNNILYESLHFNALNNAKKFSLEEFKKYWLEVLI